MNTATSMWGASANPSTPATDPGFTVRMPNIPSSPSGSDRSLGTREAPRRIRPGTVRSDPLATSR